MNSISWSDSNNLKVSFPSLVVKRGFGNPNLSLIDPERN